MLSRAIPITEAIEETHQVKPFVPKNANDDFDNVLSAFDAMLDKFVLTPTHNPPFNAQMSFINSILDIFKKDGRYSFEVIIKLILSLSIGGLTSLFNLKPSADAITKVLASIFCYYHIN